MTEAEANLIDAVLQLKKQDLYELLDVANALRQERLDTSWPGWRAEVEREMDLSCAAEARWRETQRKLDGYGLDVAMLWREYFDRKKANK